MNTYQFSIRIYVKDTRITPFVMPRNGMYQCHWTETGICHFEGIENGYFELRSSLENHFHLDQPTEDGSLLEYYDRLADTLMDISNQTDFETALMHSSQTYSPFSLLIKVNAKQRDEQFTNGFNFGKAWRISKPKFTCIRKWLLDLQDKGETLDDISNSCLYGERAFLFSQFRNKSTNQNEPILKIDQSLSTKISSCPIKPNDFELIDSDNATQKMLHEKMMMDPVISLVLFNEFIPLKQPSCNSHQVKEEKFKADDVAEKMGELCIGNVPGPISPSGVTANDPEGLFIRSEAPEKNSSSSGGMFLRSEDPSSNDDWVIA